MAESDGEKIEPDMLVCHGEEGAGLESGGATSPPTCLLLRDHLETMDGGFFLGNRKGSV